MPTVLSIDKCLDLLEAVAAHRDGVGTRELARELGINVTTVHNIARTLARRGYLRQDSLDKRFSPGVRLYLLARTANLNQELTTLAHPYVRRAVEITGETAMLATFEQGRIIRMVQIASRQALIVREQEDMGAHAYCTATGKMLLSALPEDALQAFLQETPLVRHTRCTLATPEELMQGLELTRERGFALAIDECYEGVSAAAVAVMNPWGSAVAALGVSAPTQRFGKAEQGPVVAALQQISHEITAAWANAGRANSRDEAMDGALVSQR